MYDIEVSFLIGLIKFDLCAWRSEAACTLTQRPRSGRYNGKRATVNDWSARGEEGQTLNEAMPNTTSRDGGTQNLIFQMPYAIGFALNNRSTAENKKAPRSGGA